MNNENETAAALERARCEVRFFRDVLEQIATPGPRVRRLKLAQAALGFWASLRGSEARIAPERIVDAEGRLVQERDELLREHSAMLGRIAAGVIDESQDYRRGGKSPNEVAERRAQQKGNE